MPNEKVPDQFDGIVSESFNDGEPVKPEPLTEKESAPEAEQPKEPVEAPEEPESAEPAEDSTGAARTQERPRKSAQDRINEMRRKQSEAEARAARAERELAELRARPAAEPKTALTEENKPTKRDPNARPRLEEYTAEQFEQFEDDLLEWKLAQKDKAKEAQRQADAAAREAQEFQSAAEKKFEVGAKKFTDFIDKVVVGGRDGKYHLADDTLQLAVESDVGTDILYHLATHPDEAQELAGLPEKKRAAAFGRLEARFSASAAPEDQSETRERLPTPPRNQPRGSGGRFNVDKNDFAAVEAQWQQEMKRRAGG
jgi:hypothetical protein